MTKSLASRAPRSEHRFKRIVTILVASLVVCLLPCCGHATETVAALEFQVQGKNLPEDAGQSAAQWVIQRYAELGDARCHISILLLGNLVSQGLLPSTDTIESQGINRIRREYRVDQLITGSVMGDVHDVLVSASLVNARNGTAIAVAELRASSMIEVYERIGELVYRLLGEGVSNESRPPVPRIVLVRDNGDREDQASLLYCYLGERVSLDAADSYDPEGTTLQFEWYTDSDNEPDGYSSSIGPLRETATPGVKVISLTVLNAAGLSRSTSITLVVSQQTQEEALASTNLLPIGCVDLEGAVHGRGSSEFYLDEAITLDGSRSRDPDGRIIAYEWDFDGDADPELLGQRATIEWGVLGSGTHHVALRIRDDLGGEALARTEFTILEQEQEDALQEANMPPTALIACESSHSENVSEGVYLGDWILLDGRNSVDPDGRIIRYEWDFDGDTCLSGWVPRFPAPS